MTRKIWKPALSLLIALTLILVTPITVLADPPVAFDDLVSTNEDTPVIISVLANDTDIDEDTLQVISVTMPDNGTAVIGANSTVTYSPNINFNGIDSFDYTVDDGKGGTDNGTVNVTIFAVNDPPVAVDDSASTNEDTPVNINVLTNDSDVEGDILSVTSVTTPAYGIAVIETDYSITYSPDTNFNGIDSFDYTVDDGNGGTDNGTVIITVGALNDPPVADANGPYMASEGTAVNFDASGSSDVDGDNLQYRWDFDDDGTWDTTWSNSPLASNTWYDNRTGTTRVEVSDGLLSDNVTASVIIYNVAPFLDAGPNQIIYSGDNVTVDASFIDPGTLDTHTATIDWGDGSASEPGTVIESAGSGSVTGSHRYTALGSYTITVTVTDDDGGSSSDSFQVEVRTVTVTIDIKPGSYPNSINLGSNGRIPVAIITTADFDATEVDPTTVRFGPGGAIPVQYAIEDINGDDDDDMILHFNTQELGLDKEDTEATLTGQTEGGANFTGTDSVRIVPTKEKQKPDSPGNGKAIGKENAPGQNKEQNNPADGKAIGKENAPGQNKEQNLPASGQANGKENAPGQNKEQNNPANGQADGKENAPGQNKEQNNAADGKASGKENAPGQNKEQNLPANGQANGKENAPGQNKGSENNASGKGKNK
jgi:hypothetical protein